MVKGHLSSKNRIFKIRVSQRLDWESSSPSHGSWYSQIAFLVQSSTVVWMANMKENFCLSLHRNDPSVFQSGNKFIIDPRPPVVSVRLALHCWFSSIFFSLRVVEILSYTVISIHYTVQFFLPCFLCFLSVRMPRQVQHEAQHFDDVLKYVGEFGLWQKFLYFASCFLVIESSALQLASLVFVTGTPRFHCVTPNVTCDENKCCEECTSYSFQKSFTSTVTEVRRPLLIIVSR